MDDAPDTTRPIEVDYVTAELMIETARSCRNLIDAVGRVDIEITDGRTKERFIRRMERLTLFYRTVPSILDERRMIAFGDMCADHPDWWKANKIHALCPQMTQSDIAYFLHLRYHQVRDAIKAVQIPQDCYDNLPKP